MSVRCASASVPPSAASAVSNSHIGLPNISASLSLSFARFKISQVSVLVGKIKSSMVNPINFLPIGSPYLPISNDSVLAI